MGNKILCEVSDLTPIAEAVRNAENKTDLYSLRDLSLKASALLANGSSDGGSTVQIQTGTATPVYNNDEGLYMFDVQTDFNPDYFIFNKIYYMSDPVSTAGFDFTIKSATGTCITVLPYDGVNNVFALSAKSEENRVITTIFPMSYSGSFEPDFESFSVNYTAIKL